MVLDQHGRQFGLVQVLLRFDLHFMSSRQHEGDGRCKSCHLARLTAKLHLEAQ